MKLRAIIIDDEQKGIEALSILIETFIKDVHVVATSTDPVLGIKLIDDYQPEIVFLDINMPELNGFELLEKISWKEFNLIFTTAHEEYALKALKANAIDYLLKPIDHEDLRISVEKISQQISSTLNQTNKFNISELLGLIDVSTKHKICISTKSGIDYLETDTIIFLESKSNYTSILLDGGRTILVSRGLKEFEEELCHANINFMRVHNSYIVNLQKVSRYLKNTDHIVLLNDQKIPLAKSRKDDFFKWLKV